MNNNLVIFVIKVGRPGFDYPAKSPKGIKSWYSLLDVHHKKAWCEDRPASSLVVSLGKALKGVLNPNFQPYSV